MNSNIRKVETLTRFKVVYRFFLLVIMRFDFQR